MKKSILTFLVCLSVFAISAQEYEKRPQELSKDQNQELYYQHPGKFSLHLSNFMFGNVKSVSMPISINPQVTIFKNFTAGPTFTYFKSKYAYNAAHNVQVWENSDEVYRSLMPGLKGEYHLMPLLDKMTNKPIKAMYVDLYVHSWVGYQFVLGDFGTRENPNYKDQYQALRGGVGVGVRSMLLPFLGVFLEVGYSQVGYGSFGLSFKLN